MADNNLVLYHFINLRIYSNSVPNLAGPSPHPSVPPTEDTVMIKVHQAMVCWRKVWLSLREQTSDDEWTSYGLFANSYSFWMVAQLLISKREKIERYMFMGPKCPDKLDRLKLLA